MARSFTVFFVTALLMFSGSAYGVAPQAAAKQVALTAAQRKAIQALFSYAVMDNNPVYAERDLQQRLSDETFKKICEKRGKDLKPLEQIQLVLDTLYLNFADSLLTDFTIAFIVSWVVLGGVDLVWRAHCLAVNKPAVNIHSDVELVSHLLAPTNSSFPHPIDPCLKESNSLPSKLGSSYEYSNSLRYDSRRSFGESSSLLQNNRQPYSFKILFEGVKSQLKGDYSEYFEYPKQWASGLGSWRTSASNSRYVSAEKLSSGRHSLSDPGNTDSNSAKNSITAEDFLAQKKKVAQWELLVQYAIRWAPLVKGAVNYVHQHVQMSRGKTPAVFLTKVLACCAEPVRREFEVPEKFAFLLDFFIAPLWTRYNGSESEICSELARMGERIRVVERLVTAEKSESLALLTMGIHGFGFPSLYPTRFEVASKAYGKDQLKRMSAAAFAGIAVLLWDKIGNAFQYPLFSQNFEASKDRWAMVFSWVWTILTVYKCASSVWNRDNKQARLDYIVFLKRARLDKAPHQESFYWSWFLPMWRLNRKDVLVVEKMFIERTSEVELHYEQLKALGS